ncbi:MAG: IPTL-CTERM sorting domain-containing protein [Thermodesulfobacteriota bacterium]
MLKQLNFHHLLFLSILFGLSTFFICSYQVNAQGPECPLTIIKSADPADDTEFDFLLAGNAVDPNFTLQDPSNNSIVISVVSNIPGVFINEVTPPGWFLQNVVCEGDPGFEFIPLGSSDLIASCTSDGTIPEGQCTFFNSRVSPVPTISQWGLIALVVLIGLAGLFVYRRKLQSA